MESAQRNFFPNSFFGFFLGSFLVFFLLPSFCTAAAQISLVSSKSSVSVGDVFTVTAYVSADASVNALSGILSFPASMFEIQSVSKSNSIVGFWVNDPQYSNTSGTVGFEGVVLNPGFTGTKGKVLHIVVKARAAGSGQFSYTDASVLANDGLGTNVLSGMTGTQISVAEARALPASKSVSPTPEKNIIIPPASLYTASTTTTGKDNGYIETQPVYDIRVPPGTEFEYVDMLDTSVMKAGRVMLLYVIVVIALVGLLLSALFGMWYAWHRFSIFKQNLRAEVKDVESAVHKSFALLREEVEKHVVLLEKTEAKRALTREEKKMLAQFKSNLADAETFIEKEVADIKKVS